MVSYLLISYAKKIIFTSLFLAYIDQLRSDLLNWTSLHVVMNIITAGQAAHLKFFTSLNN